MNAAASQPQGPAAPPAWGWLDVCLVLFATLVTAAALSSVQTGPQEVSVGPVGWLLAPVLGLLLVLRRQLPLGVLLTSAGCVFGYYMTDRPAIGMELPLAAAFLSCAERGRTLAAIVVGLLTTALAYGYRLGSGQDDPRLLGIELLTTMVVIGGAIGIGDAIRSRERQRVAAQERQRLIVAARERELLATVEEERRRIARDIHDVIAHTLVVVGQQASIAQETAHSDPAATQAALGLIRESTRSARRELQDSLVVLRSGDGEGRAPISGLADLDQTVERFARAGVRVEVDTVGDQTRLPSSVDSTAYRIIQEALTNVAKHSGARRAQVRIVNDGSRVELTISDPGGGPAGGPGGPTDGPGGHGLAGMRERVALLGGSLSARADEDGRGFVVRASIPTTLEVSA